MCLGEDSGDQLTGSTQWLAKAIQKEATYTMLPSGNGKHRRLEMWLSNADWHMLMSALGNLFVKMAD